MRNAVFVIRQQIDCFRIAGAEFGFGRSSPAKFLGVVGGEGWSFGPVRTADGFLDRWRGLRPRAEGWGMLLQSRSVHSFGMKEPLWICGLRDMKVVAVRKMVPARIAWLEGADMILELPIEVAPPPVGLHLSWLDAGPVDSLRYPDRQSR